MKRDLVLLKGLVQVLVLPFTAQLGKLGTVVHRHQCIDQNVIFGLLA